MLTLCRVTNTKVTNTFLILANFNLFEFSAAILEKGLFRFEIGQYCEDACPRSIARKVVLQLSCTKNFS